MQFVSKDEVRKIQSPGRGESARALVIALSQVEVGEGVRIDHQNWSLKSWPISVARHKAKFHKDSLIFGKKFDFKVEKGTKDNWQVTLIWRTG